MDTHQSGTADEKGTLKNGKTLCHRVLELSPPLDTNMISVLDSAFFNVPMPRRDFPFIIEKLNSFQMGFLSIVSTMHDRLVLDYSVWCGLDGRVVRRRA